MAVPSVSGLAQLNPSDSNSWTGASPVGEAIGVIDSLSVSEAGINPPNTTQIFQSTVTTTDGLKYSALSPAWTAVDLSTAKQAILINFAGNPGPFNRVSTDADGITIYGFDSGAARTTDYLRWRLGGSNDPFYAGPATFYPTLLFFSDAFIQGAPDESDIVDIGAAFKANGTGTFGVDFRIDQISLVDGDVSLDGGDVGSPGSWSAYFDLLKPNAPTGITYSTAADQIKPLTGFGYPVSVNSVNFSDSNFTFAFLPQNPTFGFNPPASGYYSLAIRPSDSAALHVYSDGVFAYDSGTYPLSIDASSITTGSITMTRCSYLNVSDFSVIGAKLSITSSTLSAPATVSLQDALINIFTIDSSAAPVVIAAQLTTASLLTITNPSADALQFDFNPVDDSGRTYNVPGGATVNYNPSTTGTYTHTGIIRVGAGNITFDNLSANNITVNVTRDVFNNSAIVSTGGGTITLVEPVITIDITAPAHLDNTRERLYNIDQDREIDNSIVTLGGGYAITLTEGVDYNDGDDFVLLGAYQELGVAKRVFRAAFTAGLVDVNISDAQVDWDEPNVLAIDGDALIGFSTDYIQVQVEVDDDDDVNQKSKVAAFLVNAITEEEGIRQWVSLAGDAVINYKSAGEADIDVSVASVTVLNTKPASKLLVEDAFILGWSDGINRADAILGSSIVWISPDEVLEVPQIREIYQRFDLNAAKPNTYENDESAIANVDFTLDKTDNGDGTFTVNRNGI